MCRQVVWRLLTSQVSHLTLIGFPNQLCGAALKRDYWVILAGSISAMIWLWGMGCNEPSLCLIRIALTIVLTVPFDSIDAYETASKCIST